MSNSRIRTHVDFKVEALNKLANLLTHSDHTDKKRVNILTAFGTIEGEISASNPSREDIFNLKSLMDDVIVDEYVLYLESKHPEKTFHYNFVALDHVVVKPYSNPGTGIEYPQLIVYVDQIVAFNFL